MTESPPAIRLKNLTKVYSGLSGDLPILNGVSLELRPGEAIAVTGPSGSGKSTLLNIIGLLEPPTSGELVLAGASPANFSERQVAEFRNRNLGFIFQEHFLLPQCTVLENVLLPTLAGFASPEGAETRARHLLARVGLEPRLDHRPAELSGGERQRVAVCRALINQPSVLLADEPTGSLDRRSAETIGTLLIDVAREQQAVLICVTHSQELAQRFPRHCELLDGLLVEQSLTSPIDATSAQTR